MTISIKELKKNKIPIKPAIKICRSLGLVSIVTKPVTLLLSPITGFIPPSIKSIFTSK